MKSALYTESTTDRCNRRCKPDESRVFRVNAKHDRLRPITPRLHLIPRSVTAHSMCDSKERRWKLRKMLHPIPNDVDDRDRYRQEQHDCHGNENTTAHDV